MGGISHLSRETRELRYYSSRSKKKKEDGDPEEEEDKKQAKRRISAGIALGLVSRKAPVIASNNFSGRGRSYEISEHERQVKDDLLKKARNQGIKIVEMPSESNSAYMGTPLAGKLKKMFAPILKGGTFDHLGEDTIIIGGEKDSLLNSAGVLAHELGHSQYISPKDSDRTLSKDFIAKTSHRLQPISSLAASKAGILASAIHGYKSGVKSEKDKEEGKEESRWNKVRAVAVPGIAIAPNLIAEASASVKGLKMLKEAGANEDLLRSARGDLGAAFGTYAGASLLPIAAGAAGRLVGKGVTKLKNKKNRKKEKESSKENQNDN